MADKIAALSMSEGPKVDMDKIRDFFAHKAPQRNIPGGPKFSELMIWLDWATEFTGHSGLREIQTKIHDLKAGHAGWDRNKDIELVQAHSDVTIKTGQDQAPKQEPRP